MGVILKCPVCGKEKDLSLTSCNCNECGCENAYVRYFASKKCYDLWINTITTAKRERFATYNHFWLGNKFIAFLDEKNKEINILFSNGEILIKKNVVGFSSNERNYAVLYSNGIVEVYGEDNSFGQKNTESWQDISHISMGPNCICGITQSGDLRYSGSLSNLKIKEWTNLKLIKVTNNGIVGLHWDGRLSLSGTDAFLTANLDIIKTWDSISDVAISMNCIFGLSVNGRVKFAGKDNDSRKVVKDWKNIIGLVADNVYVYGLSKDGRISVAGNCMKLLDNGRSQVSEWQNIISISSSHTGIAGIDESGELHFAGIVDGGEITTIYKAWNEKIKEKISFAL